MSEAVESRRRERGLNVKRFAEVSGLTPQGLDPVRSGWRRNYSQSTILGVAKALAWPLDWYDRLQAGENAARFQTIEHGAMVPTTLEDRVSALERAVQGIESKMQALVEGRRTGR